MNIFRKDIPAVNLEKPPRSVFYLPMYAVWKESTKLRAVFNASRIEWHPRYRFQSWDVSQMYQAIKLSKDDWELHRFLWRSDTNQPLRDYHMTQVTFGACASSFAVNMSVKQNALEPLDLSLKYPRAAKVLNNSFYVDDGLTGMHWLRRPLEALPDLSFSHFALPMASVPGTGTSLLHGDVGPPNTYPVCRSLPTGIIATRISTWGT